MQVYRYEDSLQDIVDFKSPTIFLAGPTVRGNQPHLVSWRFEAIEEFKRQGFDGSLIVPEFTDKTESDKDKMWIPAWEFSGLCGCDCIMFWVPRTKELIGLTTNHEIGYWMALCRDKVVYGRPDDSYRNAYLDIMWKIDAHIKQVANEPVCSSLADTVAAAIQRSENNYRPCLRNKERVVFPIYRFYAKVMVDSPYGSFIVKDGKLDAWDPKEKKI